MTKKQPVMSHDPLAALAIGGDSDMDTGQADAGSTTNDNERTAVFSLDSSLTISEVSSLQDQLLERLREMVPLRIDASDVDAIDAAGLQLIASLFKNAREKGIDLSLAKPSDAFVASARQIGLAALFDIEADIVKP